MALHKIPNVTRRKKINDKNPSNNRVTNGCVNFNAHDLEIASQKGVQKGSKVFILPDNPHNKFKIVDGKLKFTSSDVTVNRSLNKYEAKPISVKIFKRLK